jgi:retron-type reverse transcriptase
MPHLCPFARPEYPVVPPATILPRAIRRPLKEALRTLSHGLDLMHQPQWIAAACGRVLKRSRGKVTGVDLVTTSAFQQNRRSALEQLRLELKRGTDQPLPLRRGMIPKANGKL